MRRVTSLRLRSAAESLSSATESVDRVMDPLLGIVILAVFVLTGLMGWLGNRR